MAITEAFDLSNVSWDSRREGCIGLPSLVVVVWSISTIDCTGQASVDQGLWKEGNRLLVRGRVLL